MENSRKIDRSFKERQGVLHLLEKLKKENITYAEMDEIGGLIHKAGRSAVQPLLRSISREKSGSLVSKYTYLLDFLDERYWLDQIVHIVIRHHDLELEGRSAILATLEDCGIDVTVPPFSALLSTSGLSSEELFTKWIERGEDGLISLLEEFSEMSPEVKRSFLLDISRFSDERITGFLELLLWDDNPAVVTDVITALGRIRSEAAATILASFRKSADSLFMSAIEQSLKRLGFTGVHPAIPPVGKPFMPFHSAYVGPLDGNGYRNVLLARWREDRSIDTLELQLNDINGIDDVWGRMSISADDYAVRITERSGQELLEAVDPDFAVSLLRDALQRNRDMQYPLPPEFMLRRTIFDPEEITPAYYMPPVAAKRFKITPALLTMSTQLFEDEFFAGWAIESPFVYDIADEWLKLEKKATTELAGVELEHLIERLCAEEFQPKLSDISRRIIMNADYLVRTGADDKMVMAALAAAESIQGFSLPCHLHPFLRRFAMESMIVAREALEAGYDLRDYEDDW